ncbi:MAG: hypothetical protein ACJAZ4_002122 [Neptuniibacter pectenicola]|jgi:hypothetical protein
MLVVLAMIVERESCFRPIKIVIRLLNESGDKAVATYISQGLTKSASGSPVTIYTVDKQDYFRVHYGQLPSR